MKRRIRHLAQSRAKTQEGVTLCFKEPLCHGSLATLPDYNLILHGQSMLLGMPTPTTPQTLGGFSGNLYSYDNAHPHFRNNVEVPATLYSVPTENPLIANLSYEKNGEILHFVSDTYEPCVLVDGVLRSRLTQRIHRFNPSMNITYMTNYAGGCYVSYLHQEDIPEPIGNATPCLCSHLIGSETAFPANRLGICFITPNVLAFGFDNNVGGEAFFKDFFIAESAQGRPLTFAYVRKEPQVTLGDPYPFYLYADDTYLSSTTPHASYIKTTYLSKNQEV